MPSVGNWARGYYRDAPEVLQRALGLVLSALPPAAMFGRSFELQRELIERSRFDAGFVREFQVARLRQLVATARGRSRFYHDWLAPLPPSNEVLPEHLPSIPVLEREAVRVNVEAMTVKPKSELVYQTTTGTTGADLGIYVDKDRSVREWAFVTSLWSAVGFTLGDRRAFLRGAFARGSRYWEYQPALRELRLSPMGMTAHAMDSYLLLIEQYRVTFIHGYPSAISLLAAHALQRGWRPPSRIRGVLPISEPVSPDQRAIMSEAFGSVPVYPFYGLTEKVAIAGEVPGSEGTYEFEPLYGVAELVDDRGDPVTKIGETGRLTGTGFVSTGMPLIRYETRDTARLIEPATPENCYRLRVESIQPAWTYAYLVNADRSLVPAISLQCHSPAVRDMQLIQREPGRVTVHIVREPGTPEEEVGKLAREMSVRARPGLELHFEYVDSVARGPRGKRRFVDQQLDLGEFGAAAH